MHCKQHLGWRTQSRLGQHRETLHKGCTRVDEKKGCTGVDEKKKDKHMGKINERDYKKIDTTLNFRRQKASQHS